MVKLELLLNPFSDSLITASIEGVDNLTVTPDMMPAETDNETELAIKQARRERVLRERAGFYSDILSLKDDVRFKNLESLLLQITKNIDQKQIWEAIRKGDQTMFNALVAQRIGILSFAKVFDCVRARAAQSEAQYRELTGEAADDHLPAGPNTNDIQE